MIHQQTQLMRKSSDIQSRMLLTGDREFTPNSVNQTAELDVPINNTNNAAPQVLEFEVRNTQYYFGKRQLSGGTPTGCVLYILECGVVVGSIDIDSLTSDYQTFNTTGYVPCGSNYTMQFIETCSNTGGIFPTLDLANLTLFEASNATTSSAPSSLPVSSVATGTATGVSPTSTGVTCPQNNGALYEDPTSGEVYMIQCYVSYTDNDISNNYQYNLAGCISACAAVPGCSAVNWLVGSPQGPCYLKSAAQSPAVVNSADYAAYLVSTASLVPASSLSSGVSVSTSVSGPVSSIMSSGISQTVIQSTSMPIGTASGLGSVSVITSKSKRRFV